MTKYIFGGPERFKHQKRGLRKIIETKGVCALLFDPGLGKTATALDYAALLALKSPTGEARILVAAPKAAVDTWVIEAPKWVGPQVAIWAEVLGGQIKERARALASRGGTPFTAPEESLALRKEHPRAKYVHKSWNWSGRRANGNPAPIRKHLGPSKENYGDDPLLIIETVNLDAFNSRAQVGSKTMADILFEAVKRFKPDLVIVDELHLLKGVSSNTSRLMARIGRLSERRLGLTGTVMPQSPLDVFAQWRYLEPTAFGRHGRDATFGEFKARYAEMGGFMGRQAVRFHHLDEMQDIMARNSIVARKEDSLDLPPVTPVEVPVHLSPAELNAYDDMKRDLVTRLDSGTVSAGNRLVQMMRLRQITSGHIKQDDGSVKVIGDSKVQTIRSIVNETLIGEDRVVVFADFIHEIEALQKALKFSGTKVEVIDGRVPTEERLKIRQRFGDRKKHPERIILVAQVRTISLSVNELVTAANAVYGSLTQRRADFVQSHDRLNRNGQTRPVTFWYAIVPGTVDSVTLSAHRRRTNLEDAMLSHILGTGDSEDSRLSEAKA